MYKQQSRFFRRLNLFDFPVASRLVSPTLSDPDMKKKFKAKRKRNIDPVIMKPVKLQRINDNVVKRIKE